MSDSLQALGAYPQLVGPQAQIALGQALQQTGAGGPAPVAAASSLSPVTSLAQGVLGALLTGQGTEQLNNYAQQQQQQLAVALQQQNSILTGDGSNAGLPTGGGLQGGSSGTLSTNSGASNAPPSPSPVSPMVASIPNGTGGFHVPGASPYALAIMQRESGGNADATNPNSSAAGPGQFLTGTWNGFVQANPNLFRGMSSGDIDAKRSDPTYAAAATEWYADQNAPLLQHAGIAPTGPNLALAHSFGPTGAQAILRAQPGTPLLTALGTGLPSSAVQADAKANPQFANMTVDQARAQVANVPDYQVASGNTGTATDALPSPSAPPGYTGAMVGGMNSAAGTPSVAGNAAAPVVSPSQQGLARALQLYQAGQGNALSTNPRLQVLGQSQEELARALMQRGQFQTITLPNGVQAQRNATTGEISALPQRPVVTADGTVYDANSGQPIAGGVGAGGVRPQNVQGAALNTMAALAPLVSAGQATPQQLTAYSAAATAFRGPPSTYTKADGTTGTYLAPLPPGFPDLSAQGAPGATPGGQMSTGQPVGGAALPGLPRSASAMPQSQGETTGTALANSVPQLRAAGQTGQRVLDQVGQIKQAMAGAAANGLPQGYFSPELGEAAAAAKYLGITLPGLQPGAVSNQQTAEATLKQFGGAVLKTMFPNRITNTDVQLFLPSMGDLSHDPQAVSKILDNAGAYAAYDVNKSQAMERQLAANGGQLPPTWEAQYNLIHGSAARLAPVPSQQTATRLGWGAQGVPANVSNLNGFGQQPRNGAPPVGTVATNPQTYEQQVMTMLGWRPYQPSQGVTD